MKKRILHIFMVCMVIMSAFGAINTYAATDGLYTYTVSLGEATITRCSTSASGDVVIPDTVGGYPVAAIGYQAFNSCTGITGISLPERLTSIGDRAFVFCSGLTNITIPKNITSIGTSAFEQCTNLTDIFVSEENQAFASVDGVLFNKNKTRLVAFPKGKQVTTYNIPDGVATISNSAFYYCSSLTNVTIPDSVAVIEESAFEFCEGLTSVIIGNGVSTIGKYAFGNCSAITEITIPDSVTTMGNGAFQTCNNLTDVNISSLDAWCNIKFESSSATPLSGGRSLYLNGNLVTDVVVPEGITDIGYALSNYTYLKSVTLPNSVTAIGYASFAGCTGLTSVSIPNSVTSIGYYAFEGCSSLTDIQLPDSVETISDSVFLRCSSLKSINIPNGVTTIGNNVFYDCSSLTDISIPGSVTSIGNSAFGSCSSLTDISIPSSVTTIGSSAFMGCTGLTNITIPDSVTTLGDTAFQGCTGLKSVTLSKGITTIEDALFQNCTSLTNIALPDGVAKIGNHAFAACSDLTDITIPTSVTSIGNYTFAGCTNLASIKLFNNLATIGTQAFYNCTSLKAITIPPAVTSIGAQAFYNCTGLTDITVPAAVTSIGDGAFYGCTGLKKVDIESLKSWCGITFASSETNPLTYAKHLYLNGELITKLAIPEGVTSIGNYAFYNCQDITTVIIPEGLTKIGTYTFNGCSAIETVCFKGAEEDYKINISSIGNSPYFSADKIYFDGMDAVINSKDCLYDNSKVTATVKLNYLEQQSGALYMAIYDGVNLVAIKDEPVAIGETEKTLEIEDKDGEYIGCDIRILYWNAGEGLIPFAKPIESKVTLPPIVVDEVLESAHSYASNTDETKTYTYPGECSSIDVTFSDDTKTQGGTDYIYIYDANDNQIGRYSGTQLAGQTINVPGNQVKIRLTSNSSMNYYGYKTESIFVNR